MNVLSNMIFVNLAQVLLILMTRTAKLIYNTYIKKETAH